MREVTAHARGYGDKSINLWWPYMMKGGIGYINDVKMMTSLMYHPLPIGSLGGTGAMVLTGSEVLVSIGEVKVFRDDLLI